MAGQSPVKRKLMYDFFSETSFHGIDNIKRPHHRAINLMWFLVFLAFFGLTCWAVYVQVDTYQAKPTVVDYSIRRNASTELPTPAICSNTRFKKSKLIEYNVSFLLQHTLNFGFPYIPSIHYNPDDVTINLPPSSSNRNYGGAAMNQSDFSYDDDYYEEEEETLGTSTQHSKITSHRALAQRLGANTFRDVVDALSVQCQDVIESCKEFGINKYPFDCCKDATSKIFLTGLCYIPKIPTQSSIQTGFQVLAKVSPPTEKSYSVLASLQENGIYFRLVTKLGWPGSPRFLSPGTYTTASIYLTKIDSINNPPNYSCNDSTGYNEVICMQECIHSQIRDLCGCVYVDSDLSPPCDPYQILKCYNEPRFFDFDMNKAAVQCSPKCPAKCTEEKYDISLSQVGYDPFFLQHYSWGKEEKVLELLNHRATMEIFYERLDYFQVKQQFAMTFESLMSKIGGVFGLYLGASFISFIHIFLFFFQRYCGYREQRKQRTLSTAAINPSPVGGYKMNGDD